MLSFLKPNKNIFGLDISQGSLKIVELQKFGKSVGLKSFARAEFPKGLVINDVVTDNKVFAHILSQTMQKPQYGKLDTNRAVVGIPESKSFVRVIQIPLLTDKEIENAVLFEAENFIPMPIDQVYMDWQKLGESSGKLNILIIATPKDFVDKLLSVLDECGIVVQALEADSQSVRRSVLSRENKETLLIVDIESGSSNLVMVEDGHLQFTSSVPIAGNNFTDSIAKSLGVSFAKAEEIKQKVGIANTADYPNIQIALLPTLGSLTEEIKGILKFHREHYSQKPVSRLVLCGGGARLKNLPQYFSEQFSQTENIRVELGNPWINFPEIKNIPLDNTEVLDFTGAIGMAMRNFK